MSLEVSVGHAHLAKWGFSTGDIAVLSGAGRYVGNWIMNRYKDQALLEFMKIEQDDLIPRKGILDITLLHRRWDTRVTLLQNGRQATYGGRNRPVIENMDKFSWMMTLVTAALDAALQLKSLESAMAGFLTGLFEEQVDGLEYLQRELRLHIQGWMSAAIVRGIVASARNLWESFLRTNLRLPGQIPSLDVPEITQFLFWLTGSKSYKSQTEFTTPSRDIYCLALLLQGIGFDSLQCISTDSAAKNDIPESQLTVLYVADALAIDRMNSLGMSDRLRVCMRVPLQCAEECVSVWPGSAGENNRRRQLFRQGWEAVKTVVFSVHQEIGKSNEVNYYVSDKTSVQVGRLDERVHLLINDLFPIANPALAKSVEGMMQRYPNWPVLAGDVFAGFVDNDRALSDTQVLVLGYYYSLFRTLVKGSSLSRAEAFGSWGWNDLGLLKDIRSLLANRKNVDRLTRPEVLKFVSIFFTGADDIQWKSITAEHIGIHGKISAVAASLLGQCPSPERAVSFILLDVDPSAIPSTSLGLIRGGTRATSTKAVAIDSNDNLQVQRLADADQSAFPQDFTSHIEPDWDVDTQTCHVVFRYRGRVVRRFSPLDVEEAMFETSRPFTTGHFQMFENVKESYREQVIICRPEHFFETHPFVASSPRQPLLVPVKGHVKARACILTIYHIACWETYTREFARNSGASVGPRKQSWIEQFTSQEAIFFAENSQSTGPDRDEQIHLTAIIP